MLCELTTPFLCPKLFLIVKVHLRVYPITDEMAVQGYFYECHGCIPWISKMPSKQVQLMCVLKPYLWSEGDAALLFRVSPCFSASLETIDSVAFGVREKRRDNEAHSFLWALMSHRNGLFSRLELSLTGFNYL